MLKVLCLGTGRTSGGVLKMADKNKDINVSTEHVFQHNVYVKKMSFPDSGTTYCGHHHDYDHVTMVASGKVRVKFSAVPEAGIGEEIKEYNAVSTFVTRSFREHEITSLEPDTVVCCIHAVRDKDGEIVIPETPSDKVHDPDHRFHSMKEVASTVKKIPGRMAFTASLKDKQNMLIRAEKEGTLVPNSGDMLIND